MKITISSLASTLAVIFLSISFNACNDPCDGIDCNGGTCLDAVCDCPENYVGDNCEIYIDPCNNVNCFNGGTCVDGDCECPPGFTGSNCQTQIDPCENYPCVNGTRVNVDIVTCDCECYPGYMGDDCNEPIPGYSPLHATYAVQQTCNGIGSSQYYTITVSPGNNPPQEAILHNLFGNGNSLNASIDGNQLVIPSQQTYALGVTGIVLGSGTLNGNTLTLNYRINHASGIIYCSAVCTK